jgi:hypothetical protein
LPKVKQFGVRKSGTPKRPRLFRFGGHAVKTSAEITKAKLMGEISKPLSASPMFSFSPEQKPIGMFAIILIFTNIVKPIQTYINLSSAKESQKILKTSKNTQIDSLEIYNKCR